MKSAVRQALLPSGDGASSAGACHGQSGPICSGAADQPLLSASAARSACNGCRARRVRFQRRAVTRGCRRGKTCARNAAPGCQPPHRRCPCAEAGEQQQPRPARRRVQRASAASGRPRRGTTSSASPWTSSTGGRAGDLAGQGLGGQQRAGVAQDRRPAPHGRRSPACSAIMAPWLKPISARPVSGRPSRGQLGVHEGIQHRRGWLRTRPPSPAGRRSCRQNHCRPIGAP